MNNYETYSDIELLALVREENSSRGIALDVLWKKYSKNLYNYCLYKTFNVQEAEDIHQKSWIQFYEFVKSGKEIKSISKFLIKAACFLIKDKYRLDNTTDFTNVEDFNLDEFSDPNNLLNQIENVDLVNKVKFALNILDDDMKSVFLMKWFGDLSYPEIAETTSETTDCVRMRSNRAMSKILKFLKPIIKEISEGDSNE